MDLCSKPEAVNNYINTEAGPSYEMDGSYSPNKKEHICAGAKNKSPNTQLPSMWAWKAPPVDTLSSCKWALYYCPYNPLQG